MIVMHVVSRFSAWLTRRERMALLVLLGAAFILRIGVIGALHATDPALLTSRGSDVQGFFDTAEGLITHGAYVRVQSPDVPEVFRPPGYPLFLALFFLLFSDPVLPIVLVQAVVSVATAWFIYRIARQVWNVPAGFFAAVLFSLDFLIIYYAAVTLSETLFLFFLVVSLWFGVQALHDPVPRRLAGLGIALAATALVRPVALYLGIPVTLFFCVLWLARRMPARTMIKHALFLFVPWLVLTQAWSLRNLHATDAYVFSNSAGILFECQVEGILAQVRGVPFNDTREDTVALLPPDLEERPVREQEEIFMAMTKKTMREYPGAYAASALRGMALTLFLPGEPLFHAASWETGNRQTGYRGLYTWENIVYYAHTYPERFLISLLVFFFLIGAYAAAAVGMHAAYMHYRSALPAALFLLLVAAYFIAINTVAGCPGIHRYRLPVLPSVFVLAGAGIVALFERVQKNHSKNV